MTKTNKNPEVTVKQAIEAFAKAEQELKTNALALYKKGKAEDKSNETQIQETSMRLNSFIVSDCLRNRKIYEAEKKLFDNDATGKVKEPLLTSREISKVELKLILDNFADYSRNKGKSISRAYESKRDRAVMAVQLAHLCDDFEINNETGVLSCWDKTSTPETNNSLGTKVKNNSEAFVECPSRVMEKIYSNRYSTRKPNPSDGNENSEEKTGKTTLQGLADDLQGKRTGTPADLDTLLNVNDFKNLVVILEKLKTFVAEARGDESLPTDVLNEPNTVKQQIMVVKNHITRIENFEAIENMKV